MMMRRAAVRCAARGGARPSSVAAAGPGASGSVSAAAPLSLLSASSAAASSSSSAAAAAASTATAAARRRSGSAAACAAAAALAASTSAAAAAPGAASAAGVVAAAGSSRGSAAAAAGAASAAAARTASLRRGCASSSSSSSSSSSGAAAAATAAPDVDAPQFYVPQDGTKVPFARGRGAVEAELDPMFQTTVKWTAASAKKTCMFCKMGKDRLVFQEEIFDPVNVPMWLRFMTPEGRIMPKSATGTCTKHQRKVARTIKRARHMGFFNYKAGYNVNSPFAMFYDNQIHKQIEADDDAYDAEDLILNRDEEREFVWMVQANWEAQGYAWPPTEEDIRKEALARGMDPDAINLEQELEVEDEEADADLGEDAGEDQEEEDEAPRQ